MEKELDYFTMERNWESQLVKTFYYKDGTISVVTQIANKENSKYFNDCKQKNKTMKKSDLKTGMRVELRNGNKHVVVKGDGVFIGLTDNMVDYYDFIECLNSDLTNSKGNGEFDIIKVYKKPFYSSDFLKYEEKGELLWERKEDVKLDIDITINGNKISKDDIEEKNGVITININ